MLKVTQLLAIFLCCLPTITQADEAFIYVGSYTGGESKGIYLLGFDTSTGRLTHKGLAGESENPSFLAVHPDGKHLYAVNETGTGEISAFEIDPQTHKLRPLNKKPSGGGAPCHLVIDETGKTLLVANYSGGNVSATRIDDNGSLGEQTAFIQHEGSSVNPQRQVKPHAHSINLDTGNRFAVAADLGTDELVVYKFAAATGTLTAHSSTKVQSGSGPRHFAFHPNGKYAYAINELRSTVTALEYDAAAGKLSKRQTISTLPADFDGKSFTAEVRVSPDGRFVYGSNRGHDSIAVFRVEEEGTLSLVQIESIGGKSPRNFNLDPSGRFLLAAGQATNDIHVFRLDKQTGRLERTEHKIEVPTPVCIRFAE